MQFILIFLTAICVSMYYFPFEFIFLPGINTKHILLVFGMLCLSWDIISYRKIEISRELFGASLIAILFSLIGLYATDFNRTKDYSYATYFFSMWIWLIACYGVCTVIRITHGYISVKLIINYLIIVCLFQTIIALCIHFIPSVKAMVDAVFITGDLKFLEKTKRLYGIGALLDVAGGRFAVVLVMIAFLLSSDIKIRVQPLLTILYVVAFLIIAILGSVIARTTSVGLLVSLLYLLLISTNFKPHIKIYDIKFRIVILFTICFLLLLTYYFYYTDESFYTLFRFAFEGFFNYVETGVWETDSTEILKDMWVFPDNMKTWIIGDGYFQDPYVYNKFYMGTDVGYLRFIFYSGLAGLFTFCSFFIYLSVALSRRFPLFKNLFYLLLLLVFINWVKVSTDIFLVYAFFLVISQPFFLKHYKSDTKPI